MTSDRYMYDGRVFENVKLEEDYVNYAADVEKRANEVAAASPEIRKDTPLCPICMKNELTIKEGKMQEGQNVCVDCGNLTCLDCGSMQQSVTSKEMEWVCHMCGKRRQLVLSSGMWHPGCDVHDDVPLAKEIEEHMYELENLSKSRGPLVRSASVDVAGVQGGYSRSFSLQRQASLPGYRNPVVFMPTQGLEIIQETGLSDQADISPEPPHSVGSPDPPHPAGSPGPTHPAASPASEHLQRSSTGSGLKGSGLPSSRSESEYSDFVSDVDMEDVSLSLYVTDATATDGVSPDDGSDDYSFMSIGSSDDGSGRVRRRHRPKSLNLSRSHSASSSDDERTDSEVSTDVESKYNAVAPPEPHDIRIALAASAFVEDMRVVDMTNDMDDEVAQLSAVDMTDEAKRRFSPSAPISPSWREGLDSPPFSPRRRDSYPGKKRGTSPISPKDKHFMYADMSPPSRQLSLEELYDMQVHVAKSDNAVVPFAQRPSPKSPDEIKDTFYSTSGQILSFDKPTSNMKKSKPFYSLDTAQDDELEDTTTIMDLAAYAASVASSTANLTSMTISPTNVEQPDEPHRLSPESLESLGSTSPVSPEYYDNAPYPDEARDSDDKDDDTDPELADPSQKSIDYQGTKRQKVRPPTTDWSPVIDLSPILDVSPSLEEAEQAEMLAQQQEERQRQASKEEDDDESVNNMFAQAALNQKDVEYMYYGLKRYAPVEDISELVRQNNDIFSPERSPADSEESAEKRTKERNGRTECNEIKPSGHELNCVNHCPVTASDSVVKQKSKINHSDATNSKQFRKDNSHSQSRNRNIEQPENIKTPESQGNVISKQEETRELQSHSKIRRKLPEPTPDIMATQHQPVPKPRRKERPAEPPPPATAQRSSKSETREPSRKAPILDQSVHTVNANINPINDNRQRGNTDLGLQKQDSDERKRTAKDMKAKPDPFVIKHIETEEASASPQYKVLESPPSPESKSLIRREYSDSTSVSPSSSPDRDVYLYPSPVTPPDSDSSPPKPHSPSSGTDFEEEGVYLDSPLFTSKGSVLQDKHANNSVHSSRNVEDKVRIFEKEGKIQSPIARTKPPAPLPKEQKTKEMKKVRRKLPQIPPEDETYVQHKPKTSRQPARKPPKTEPKPVRKQAGASSTSDDSSMNEDDKEVASIIRKKSINDLDKPSQDKRNGNYLQAVESSSMSSSNGYGSSDILQANIPPDVSSSFWKDATGVTYMDETDLIIDSLISIYGEPITIAMKGLKKRLQEEVRRVTDCRRRRIDDIEEIRALTLQIGELKLGAEKNRNANVAAMAALASNGNKRGASNSRSSPQILPRRARHKRQSSDPMIAKFSPIKEDKDIESEMQGRISDDNRSSRAATDDSSQSGISDTDSTRSEPIQGVSCRYRKVKPSDYAKMFYSKQAQSAEEFDNKDFASNLISSQSEGNIPLNAMDEETRMREEKRRELQYEIEKRKRQLVEKTAQLKETRASMSGNISGTSKHLAHSCDELSRRSIGVAYIPPRPIPTGIIKPIDDESDTESKDEYADSRSSQANYSSTEYLAHKQEELLKQRFEELGAYSTEYLYSGNISEKSAFLPPGVRTNLDQFSYSTGNVNISRDPCISCSITLPEIHNVRSDIDNNNRQPSFESDTNSSPHEVTPAMPLLTDITTKSRRIIHQIGSGSRPVSAEFNLGDVDELMNGMYRVESDNSVDADEPIMKHMTEGGVTILKQLERKKQPVPTKPKKYTFTTKRILLSTDPKDRSVKGRHGNSIGMKIVGGKQAPGAAEVGAYVATIYKGGVAERLHGELQEGDQILEWNGIDLSGKSYEEVQQVIAQANGEIELVVRPSPAPRKLLLQETASDSKSCHSSYDNLDSDEETDRRQKPIHGVDPKQLAAQLEEIKEAESPCISQSSSQHDAQTPSASSACSSPRSDHTSTSSDQRQRRKPACRSPDPREQQQLHPSADQHYRNMNHAPNTAPRQQPDRPAPKPRQRNIPNITKSPECQRRLPKSPAPRHCKTPPAVERTPISSAGNSPAHQRDHHAHGGNGKEKQPRISASRSLEQKRSLTPVERCQDQRPQLSSSHSLDAQRTLSPAVSEPRLRKVSAPACVVDTSDMLECTRRGREMGDIRLQLDHDDNQHVFKVNVKQARNLLPKDFNGLSDPFVKIYLLPGRCSDNKRRTKHVPRTLHPEWNETILFPNVHVEELRNKTLEVTVWDYDRFKTNDFLGEVVLDLSEEGFLDNTPHWYPLCEHDDSKGVDLPRPTVLPPRSGRQSSSPQPKPRSPRSPRAKSKDRVDKTVQNNGGRDERIRHGLGRRRRSFGTLVDVDKV